MEPVKEKVIEPAKDPVSGMSAEATDPISRSERVIAEEKEILKQIQEERKRLEELYTKQILSGRSTVTPQQPEKEETAQEYAARVLQGRA